MSLEARTLMDVARIETGRTLTAELRAIEQQIEDFRTTAWEVEQDCELVSVSLGAQQWLDLECYIDALLKVNRALREGKEGTDAIIEELRQVKRHIDGKYPRSLIARVNQEVITHVWGAE